MKRALFAALAALLGLLALGGAVATTKTGDPINLLISVGLAVGSWRAGRAARRRGDKADRAEAPGSRP